MLDSFRRGEAPMASHKLYTDVLNDNVPEDRALGIDAGLLWGMQAEQTVVYKDLGISRGMELGIQAAVDAGRDVIERSLDQRWLTVHDLKKPEVWAVLVMVERGDGVWEHPDGPSRGEAAVRATSKAADALVDAVLGGNCTQEHRGRYVRAVDAIVEAAVRRMR